MQLESVGWTPAHAAQFADFRAEGYVPGRVAAEHQHVYRLLTEAGELLGEVSGRFRHQARSRAEFPATGDWVALETRPQEGRATIHAVLPRKSRFSRKAAGEQTAEQVVAANVDSVFLVMGLDRDYNLRRIERYVATAWDSGARPIVLLSKADLATDVAARCAEVESVAPGVPVHPISSRRGEGLDAIAPYLGPGQTVAILGSSGVGKSTLINALLGESRLRTQEVRASDDRGRHTTTHRELIAVPGGALVLDTPGMRELQLWEAETGLGDAFEDIESIARACGFSDCGHEQEPRCAVREAVGAGTLAEERLLSYHKLQKEMQNLRVRQDQRAQIEQKKQWRSLHRLARKHRPRG